MISRQDIWTTPSQSVTDLAINDLFKVHTINKNNVCLGNVLNPYLHTLKCYLLNYII